MPLSAKSPNCGRSTHQMFCNMLYPIRTYHSPAAPTHDLEDFGLAAIKQERKRSEKNFEGSKTEFYSKKVLAGEQVLWELAHSNRK